MAARTRSDLNMIIGIVLIVVGALALFGWLGLGWIVTVAAVVALIVGILMLVGTLRGTTVMAVVLIVVGVLLLIPGRVFGDLRPLLETAAAILLIVLGALKIAGRW